jgi:hypothetical protein
VNEQGANEALQLSKVIARLLIGHPPEIEGAALAFLAASWIAMQNSVQPEIAESRLLAAHVNAIRQFLPLVRRMVADAGKNLPPAPAEAR